MGGKSRVADAGEGGEGSSRGEAGWVVLVGSIAKSVIVVNPGVKSRVACSDTRMHVVERLEGVAKGHNGGEGIGLSWSPEVARLMEERAGKRVVTVGQSAAKRPAKLERRAGCAVWMPRPPW